MYVNETDKMTNYLRNLLIDSRETIKFPKKARNNNHLLDSKNRAIFTSLPIELNVYSDNILLIGATGIVGALLIYKLLQKTDADIYCLVQAKDLAAAELQIHQTLKMYGLFQEESSSRIIALAANKNQQNLGISQEGFEMLGMNIDSIYTCETLSENVYSNSNKVMTEILRLSKLFKPKALHFMLFPIWE
ncbi:MAG: SDR family oxidoreductase [Rivularia sp. (in: Bacteria)]|nr:SDR family oxidoreductase [Rivularia sp. MS3]